MKTKVLLVNYGAGNMASVRNALKALELPYEEICDAPQKCPENSILILPGVGSFSSAIKELKNRNLLEFVKNHPCVLGICLGMQLLFADGDEGGLTNGLGMIDGQIRRIRDHSKYSDKQYIPHIGWQPLEWESKSMSSKLSDGISGDMYFVHSYMAFTESTDTVLATAKYGEISIPAVVARDGVVGFQFHPEKSGPGGLLLLSRAIQWLENSKINNRSK